MKSGLLSVLLLTGLTAAACSSPGSSTDAIKAGDAFNAQGKLSEAVIEYRRAVQIDGRDGHARHKLGVTLGKLGDTQRATDQLVRAADLLPGDLTVQLDAAKTLLLGGAFEDARTRAENVLKADSKNVTAHVLRATATAGLRDIDGAIEALQEAAKLDPTRSATITDLATLQMSQGKRAEAEAGFKQAVAVAPKSVQPRLALANYYWMSQRRSDAEMVLQEALVIEPNNAPANRALAGLYRATNRSALAEGPLRRLADASVDPNAKLALADYYIAEKRVADARAVLADVATRPDGAAAAQGRLAAIEYESGKRDLAFKMLSDILSKEPGNTGVMVVQGGWLLREGKHSEALAIADKASKADPRSADAHALRGAIYTAQNNPVEAINAYTAVLQLRPNDFRVQVALTSLSLAVGKIQEAGQFAREAVANAPTVAGPRHALARVFFAEGRLADAERELAPVLAAAPDSPEALGLRGLIRQRKGDTAGARQDLTRVLELNPRSVEALTGLAGLDFAAKRPAEATKRLAAATASAPSDPQIALLAGRAQAAAGDLAGAEVSFRRALDLDPSLMEAYDALGQMFVRQNKLEEARRAYDRRAEQRPDDVAAHTMVARILYVQGKQAESRARFEKILAIDPRAAVASNNLAYMDAEAGTNLDVALNRAQTAKAALPDDADVNDTLGWVYVQRGLPALAYSPLEQATQKDPKNPLYHYHLGMAYMKAGDKDRARPALQKALQLSSSFQGAPEAKQALASLGQ